MNRRRLFKLTSAAVGGALSLPALGCANGSSQPRGLWRVWDEAFARARFVSLSHVLTQDSPLWKGFPPTTRFSRGRGRLDDRAPYAPLTYEKDGFETTGYTLASDQFGTQLDPPAHWHPCFPAIDELPPTLGLRKLAVIGIVDKVAADVNYHLSLDDVHAWERANGAIPAGSVVMVRSDWSKRWADPARFQPADGKFPGVSLAALQFLHRERRILLHGHEPLDTDSTPTLIGEDWLMNNGYMQAEGVANLDSARSSPSAFRALAAAQAAMQASQRSARQSGRAACASATWPRRRCVTMSGASCGMRRPAVASGALIATSRAESSASTNA